MPELIRHDCQGRFSGERPNGVLQFLQLLDHAFGEDIASGAEELAELDEGRPKLLKYQSDAVELARGDGALGQGLPPAAEREVSMEPEPGDELAETVLQQHTGDLAVTLDVAIRP